jgi:hypothetical protein
MRQRSGFDEVMIVNPHDPARDPRETMFLGIDSLAGAASLGDYAAGEKHRYQFTVQLDASAGNAYQGDSSTTEFTWAAA